METSHRRDRHRGRPSLCYRGLVTLLSPLLVGHALWQAKRHRSPRLARQKLGFGYPRREDRPIWLHMASVGEVNAVQPLIAELQRRAPGIPVLVTTFTATGAATAATRFGSGVEHVYLPLDFTLSVRTFLARIRPRCAVIVETELWPELLHRCRRVDVPVVIVNGRLSSRTVDRAGWIRKEYRRALRSVTRVLARSGTDARRFVELGMDPERVSVLGNLKFAASANAVHPVTLPRPFIVAASTHDDEELRLGRAWLESGLSRTHLLVIVPRHPQRSEAIVRQLRPLSPTLAVRSRGDTAGPETTIYLADTFGELPDFMAGSALVCMGGSIIPRGGQNPLEAARLGRPVLMGPHMENFADERDLLLENDGALQVSNAATMISTAEAVIADPERLGAMGKRAREAVIGREGIAQAYADALAPFLSR